ncbi:hypothetical protein NAT51_06890 [Flavobacterium amniphilum]|uniref:hypothetical protein n=1 Tax=Flavobacterium amniphilum TaxID=1834035 RepID=UPI002029BF76|nr:hypothetical protein [Flavobacterium amniphilum]MCL9805239.1 hypothetical protein [Flavobacterium amniphilum]
MSLERLNQLCDNLKRNRSRYQFLDPDSGEAMEFPINEPNDNDECIHWQIYKKDVAQKIDLYFSIYNELGLYNRNISDISDCNVWYNGNYTHISLNFSKINSKRWELDMEEFITALNNFESSL